MGDDILLDFGTVEAYNIDKPVKVLSHFHDSWRYYWVMEYLDRVVWRWGVVSVIFVFLHKAFLLTKRLWLICGNRGGGNRRN